jgi:RNA polymerase sigma factor (TIGR02999 family)
MVATPRLAGGDSIKDLDLTALLVEWRRGDAAALEQLLPLVYGELREIARRCMAGERTEHTLQPTALVNEAYLRLVNVRRVEWQDRAHFLAVAARLMRRILVDHARSRGYQKRRGGGQRVPLDEDLIVAPGHELQLIALDNALEALAGFDERKSRVVELRVFAGLTVEEAALVMHVSPDTIKRDWRLAKAWLFREMHGPSV